MSRSLNAALDELVVVGDRLGRIGRRLQRRDVSSAAILVRAFAAMLRRKSPSQRDQLWLVLIVWEWTVTTATDGWS